MRGGNGANPDRTAVFTDGCWLTHPAKQHHNVLHDRHRRRPAAAVKQQHAEILLQHADLGADRRLCQADALTGHRKRTITGHGDEGMQFAQHAVHLAKFFMSSSDNIRF
ncbi:hypothetical protein SGGMMB4_02922 [Sodalis glossinidius str. 'morsitans']|uniref:Uncharacterized protein n=1 Tax=Sodalis glossinidius (strain morsitans) TaxID=343509 RepID=A0A193QJF2_SODGM|nr:hypothetical protein SGGMMB4_02922 [Sodalis glossinidius str. 'morsitans']